MDFSVALTLVQTILQLLDSSSPLRRDIESLWGYKSQLKKLENTLSFIHAVLLEADRAQLNLSLPQQVSLKRLNQVLYHADDLLDEIATLIQRKELMSGNIVTKEVTLFFSRFNRIIYAFAKCREIKEIREILDDIERDHRQFGSMLTQHGGSRTSQVSSNNSRESSSMVCEGDALIGRVVDKSKVIAMLLETAVEEGVSCVSIVGIGGLGKTTLAQLVYNDENIEREFQLRIWVCVSNDFDVKALLGEILVAASNEPKKDGLNLDQLQKNIQQELDGKKYLLVLDDVWGDITSKWDKLKEPLFGGRSKGSRILLTTRLANLADTVGGQIYELKGLSDEESWKLFEKMTNKERHEIKELNGENILKKCASVPLAIRVIGSSLRGQAKSKWMHIANTNLASQDNEDIMPVLKMSYYDLPLHLKRCFSYCAIFPKDYEINKEELIYLWMAQGFIQQNGQRLEDVGEEYFMNLLQRCFFQDVKHDDDGEIISCKMHDLIHDVAENVAGTEIMSVKYTSNLKTEVCHAFIEWGYNRFCTQMKRMRTLLSHQHVSINNVEISKVRNLRALSWSSYYIQKRPLSWSSYYIQKMPNRIGELIHLRYLDFSHADFRLLPPSITSLINLQTLKLLKCSSLEKLPKDLAKLVNLRCLDLHDCNKLKYMPPGMGNMTCLHKLTRFVLGNKKRNKANFSRQASVSGLEDLKCLKSLAGTLRISIRGDETYDSAQVKNGRYISEMEQLKKVEIELNDNNNAEALLEGLQPNRNLQMLELSEYPYERFPGCWVSKNLKSCLPQLVEICISDCFKLKHLPSMTQLPKLRALCLVSLTSLEYVESNNDGDRAPTELGGSRQGEADDLVFFPSLQILELVKLPNLVGWGLYSNLRVFPKLDNLVINECDKMTTLPLCQKGVFHIAVHSYSEALSFYNNSEGMVEINSTNVEYIIRSLPHMILHHHPYLKVQNSNNIERLLSSTKDVFRNGRVPSLLSLEICTCEEMRRLSELEEIGGHLTALETLKLKNLPKLELKWEDEDDNSKSSSISRECTTGEGDMHVTVFAITLGFFAPTLCQLILENLPNLETLPNAIQYFTSLHSLHIDDCQKMKTIPKEICHLPTLESLRLVNLPELELEWEEEEEEEENSSVECQTREGNIKEEGNHVLAPTLRSLTLQELPKLMKLPRGLHIFTSLHYLYIRDCNNLEELPAWISCFTSLHSLSIEGCKNLKSLPQEMCHLSSLQYLVLCDNSKELEKRYQKPRGAEWPKIQHIPDIRIYS